MSLFRGIDEADTTFLKAGYRGQRVEFGNSSTGPCSFSAGDGRRERQQIYYSNFNNTRMFGVEVMPKGKLIRYKSSLGDGRKLLA